MALTPEEIQALDAHFGYSPQPSVAKSPVGQLKTFEKNLEVDAAGQKAKAETLARGEAEKQLNAEKEKAALQKSLADIEMLAENVRKAKEMTGGENWFEAGYIGDKLKNTAGTSAFKLDQRLQPIRSGVAIGELMDLKRNSPTGASPFGALSGPELSLVQSKQGSLEVGQGEKQLGGNLEDIYSNYNRIYKQLSGGRELPPIKQQNSSPIPYTEYFK